MATAIDNLAAQNIQRNDASAAALESFQAATQNAYEQAIDVRKSQAQSAEVIKTTEMMATAKAQEASAKAAVALGTDPNASSYVLNQVAEQYKQASENQAKFQGRLQNVADPANLFKDPLTYLRDAIFLDLNELGAKAATAAANASRDRYIALNNMTQESAVTQNAIKQSVTADTAKMAGQLAKQEIDVQAIQLSLDSIRSASDSVVKVAQLRNNSMDVALKARDQQLQEQQIAIARQNSALQAASLRLSMEERQDRINLKQEEVKSQNELLAAVNAGRAINGNLPPFRSFSEMSTAVKMNPHLKDSISLQYQAGMTAAQTGQATLGNTPYEALKYVSSTGAKITDGRAKVVNFLDSVRNSIANDPKLASTIKKESDLSKAIDGQAKNAAAAMSKNITGGSNNIYAPPPVQVFLQDPTFAESYIAKEIFGPASKLGTEQINFKATVNSLMQGVRDKKITMETANSELGFLAEKIAGYNNALYRYDATAGLPSMKSVNVPLDNTSSLTNIINNAAPTATRNPVIDMTSKLMVGATQSLLGGSSETIVDLRDPAKRSAYLNKRLAQTIPPVLREQAVIGGGKIGGQ